MTDSFEIKDAFEMTDSRGIVLAYYVILSVAKYLKFANIEISPIRSI